ncbi:MAG: hypothetical protein MKZ85_13835, partial [Pedosphaera sp.]|nr:hypothetical protein [Pedosphaera sp.]
MESKADIIKRLGRSPDRSDAVVYGWNAGDLDAGPRARTRGRSAVGLTPLPVREYNELRYELRAVIFSYNLCCLP